MEIWDLVDGARKPLGKKHVRGELVEQDEYHIVVEILTLNKDGKLLVTQRDEAKTYPLLWEFTGGSITTGETSRIGAVRELEEETGIFAEPSKLHHISSMKKHPYYLDSYVWKSPNLLNLTDLKLQAGEVCGAKFATLAEWEEMNSQQLVIPTVWERYKRHRWSIEKIAGNEL
ncbi:NUDIX domain-containing protein [Planococcus sp. S3-L1]|uniref:NUDIX hydrolase n=1 Tax=Planococcus sp. S3-L1 TaxID=3046200 RepID=UPI0024BB7EBD|nr:NUDIX domain-containing protein [Planococcus sp. S3-L1]MDJ0332371.1 NUDIX domain-containing protein [Planococcus sp. S3-L1]